MVDSDIEKGTRQCGKSQVNLQIKDAQVLSFEDSNTDRIMVLPDSVNNRELTEHKSLDVDLSPSNRSMKGKRSKRKVIRKYEGGSTSRE